jgi:hypothetical protein
MATPFDKFNKTESTCDVSFSQVQHIAYYTFNTLFYIPSTIPHFIFTPTLLEATQCCAMLSKKHNLDIYHALVISMVHMNSGVRMHITTIS